MRTVLLLLPLLLPALGGNPPPPERAPVEAIVAVPCAIVQEGQLVAGVCSGTFVPGNVPPFVARSSGAD